MGKKLEKNGFALISLDHNYLRKDDPGYEKRLAAAIGAIAGVKSDYYHMGDYYQVYGVYDMVVEVVSDGMVSTKMAAESIRNLRIGGERPVASALPVVIIDESTPVYSEIQPSTFE